MGKQDLDSINVALEIVKHCHGDIHEQASRYLKRYFQSLERDSEDEILRDIEAYPDSPTKRALIYLLKKQKENEKRHVITVKGS